MASNHKCPRCGKPMRALECGDGFVLSAWYVLACPSCGLRSKPNDNPQANEYEFSPFEPMQMEEVADDIDLGLIEENNEMRSLLNTIEYKLQRGLQLAKKRKESDKLPKLIEDILESLRQRRKEANDE